MSCCGNENMLQDPLQAGRLCNGALRLPTSAREVGKCVLFIRYFVQMVACKYVTSGAMKKPLQEVNNEGQAKNSTVDSCK